MDEIIKLLEARGAAMALFDIIDALDSPAHQVQQQLDELVRSGRLALTKKGKYARPEDLGLTPARTMVMRRLLVARPLSGERDMVIREKGDLVPLLDDLILVRPEPHYGEGMGDCQLVSITSRAHDSFMAVLRIAEPEPRSGKRRGGALAVSLEPVDPRNPKDIQLDGGLNGAVDGDMVLLRVVRWPTRGAALVAMIERVLGDAGDIRVQLRAIAARHSLSETFPPAALRQAGDVPMRVEQADFGGRLDLRNLTLFTIDGEDAQDFDDAVSLEPIEEGVRLGVHIADVSHYVREGTAIDLEALERGTSVYLPALTLPMLPEALSNRMCSLMPGVDRLAMSLVMDIRDGSVVDHQLSPSVIHSSARLTYEQVNRMLDGQESSVPEALRPVLHDMVHLAHALREKRHARGSIDFDMPEAQFTLDKRGNPTDVQARTRGESERMIEDFMLLANETVAELARTTELPLLYRVHAKPDPDSVRSLEAFLGGLGIRARLGAGPAPAKYQKILADTEHSPEAALIKQVMLKSLRRAEYSASPEGHFGLAARDYCHFTSPIRRYPDLTVHRMLKLMLAGKPDAYAKWEGRMDALAKQCSASEQRATLAERDADELLKAHYMLSHVGELYDGIVTGVTAWGAYVTLPNTVEGLVPLRTLREEYELDRERHTLRAATGHTIRLGDPVRVLVERVNTQLAQIDFSLVL